MSQSTVVPLPLHVTISWGEWAKWKKGLKELGDQMPIASS